MKVRYVVHKVQLLKLKFFKQSYRRRICVVWERQLEELRRDMVWHFYILYTYHAIWGTDTDTVPFDSKKSKKSNTYIQLPDWIQTHSTIRICTRFFWKKVLPLAPSWASSVWSETCARRSATRHKLLWPLPQLLGKVGKALKIWRRFGNTWWKLLKIVGKALFEWIYF